ncbi:MAG: hypothetical protein J7K75_06740 [Desulfuromonas sp.]|nr:hypothetical protein [Desulfuromonas sp.]
MAVSAVVESVFNTILEQLADEIGALLGSPIKLSEHRMNVLTKEDLFAISRGRSVLSTMVVSGDQTGDAFIISDLKDSVVLGGTLIMLPKDQIEENCKLRTFEGEEADAYGEVANIIAGVYTSVFLDMYPDKLHFKRTTVADFVPSQLDPAADQPFPPGEYFHSSCAMSLEGFELKNLEVVIPAQLLGLGTQPVPEAVEEPVAETLAEIEENGEEVPSQAGEDDSPLAEAETPTDYIDSSTVNRVLKASISQCVEEIGGMLGLELALENITTRYVSKQEYFSRPGKKAIAAEMIITGDSSGTGYFITDLKDAIYLGGTMIMLPSAEIEKQIQTGELSEDIDDAFGEVANIVSGGLVQNFDEMYPRKLHLQKGEMTIFTPTKVKIDTIEPFPDGEYYQVSGSLSCDAYDLGDLSFLCPVDILHIAPRPVESSWGEPVPEEPTAAAKAPPQTGGETSAASINRAPQQQATIDGKIPQQQAAEKETIVVIVGDDQEQTALFANSLDTFEHSAIQLTTGDSFNTLRQYTIIAAFLLMSEVDEQSFAHMIKLRSEIPAQQPLIVAGPQWTRTNVIKAVRYGATDIILTPASDKEIREKVTSNLKTTCH